MSSLILSRRRLIGASLALPLTATGFSARAQAGDPLEIGRSVAALYAPSATPELRMLFWRERLSEAGRQRAPLAEFQAAATAVAATTDGVDVLDARALPGQVLLKLRSRRHGAARWVRVRIDRDEPDRLFDLASHPSPAPYDHEGPTGPLPRPRLADEIGRRLAFATANDDFSGAVLVTAPDGEVVWSGAVGVADRATGLANNLGTRFHLGSADKSFTALMIGRLVHEGRLGFGTRLIEVLPDYPNRPFAEACTIDQLLTHASGLGSLFDRPGWDGERPFTHMADLFPAFVHEPPIFAPGTGQRYSNEGFVVLGAVIEAVAGRSWYDLLAEQVYQPANMAASGHFRGDEAVANRAIGYRYADDDQFGLGERLPKDPARSYRGNSCGGGYSTVGDMTRYLRALRAGWLLPPEALQPLVTPQVGGLRDYGRGFFTRTVAGRLTVGHSGGGPHSGIDGDHAIVWETGWSLSILGNYDAPFASDISRDIMRWLAVQDA